jgi:hypothetical protein
MHYHPLVENQQPKYINTTQFTNTLPWRGYDMNWMYHLPMMEIPVTDNINTNELFYQDDTPSGARHGLPELDEPSLHGKISVTPPISKRTYLGRFYPGGVRPGPDALSLQGRDTRNLNIYKRPSLPQTAIPVVATAWTGCTIFQWQSYQ